MFIPHFNSLQNIFNFNIKAVMADAEYDSYKNIEFVAKQLKAEPIIAKNPRAGSGHKYEISKTGDPICIAGIPMYSMGKYFEKDKNRWRHKFVCRIKLIKSFSQKQPFCPWNHPNFFNNRFGCVVNLRIDVDTSIRKSIGYGSQTFENLYNLRTSSERIFYRLLTYFMQYPTVTGLNAVSNNCSIAHITVLLIALTTTKQVTRIRSVSLKTFYNPFSSPFHLLLSFAVFLFFVGTFWNSRFSKNIFRRNITLHHLFS